MMTQLTVGEADDVLVAPLGHTAHELMRIMVESAARCQEEYERSEAPLATEQEPVARAALRARAPGAPKR